MLVRITLRLNTVYVNIQGEGLSKDLLRLEGRAITGLLKKQRSIQEYGLIKLRIGIILEPL